MMHVARANLLYHDLSVWLILDVRLKGSPVSIAGRVEVFHKGRWGAVCGNLPLTTARVVCRELGFVDVLSTVQCCSLFGSGTGRIFLQDVRCRGDEPDITMCSHKGWGVTTCSHQDDVGVICKTKDKSGIKYITHNTLM